MTYIKHLVDDICEEVESAKEYAEKYVEMKAKNDISWANRFKEMANDELNHGMYLHEYVTQEIEKLRKVYTPPQEMLDMWDKTHIEYVEKVAWIKQMLTM